MAPPLRQKTGFLLAGSTGFALYYLLSLLLVRVPWLQQEHAAFIAALLAVPPTFLMQRHLAFRHRGPVAPAFAKYCALQLFNALAIGGLAWGGRRLGLVPEVNFIASGLVVLLVSYLVLSRIVFRHARDAGRAPARQVNAQYNVSRPGNPADRISTWMRRKMYARFLSLGVTADDTILDVGVTSDHEQLASNYLEAWHPSRNRITACGIDDAAFLEQRYPGVRFVRADGKRLPFPDGSFDWVHSSAVLEHVGSAAEQARFVGELYRVCRRGLFLTTPNRWFPVEFHTVLPLVHWLPPRVFRALLRRLGHEELAQERNLNLLGRREVLARGREAGIDGVRVDSVSLCLWPSNLLLIARKR